MNFFQGWCKIGDKSTDFMFELTHPRPIFKMLKYFPLTFVFFSFSIKHKPCRKPQEMRWGESRLFPPLIILLFVQHHFFKVFFNFFFKLIRTKILVIRLSWLVNDISNFCYIFLWRFIFILHSLFEISGELVQSWMVVNEIVLFLIKHGLGNCLQQSRSMRIWNVFFFVSQMLDRRVSIFLKDVDIVCLMQFQFCIHCIVRLLSFCVAFFV